MSRQAEDRQSSARSDGFRLCFIEEPWAYFSNVEPVEMSGDDWNDAPHDCNASPPYPRGAQRVVRIAYYADLEVTGTHPSGPWGYLSADQINRGEAPWLIQPSYGLPQYPKPVREVHAGITLAGFRLLVAEAGGSVYEEATS